MEAPGEKLRITKILEGEEDQIVAYIEGCFKKLRKAGGNFETNPNPNEYNKILANPIKPMAYFSFENIQADKKTFSRILSNLCATKNICNLTVDISFNNMSQLESQRLKGESILMDIGWRIGIMSLTMLDLRLQRCQINDTSFETLIRTLEITKLFFVKLLLTDNDMSDNALEQLQKYIAANDEGRKNCNLKYLEMILCNNPKITEGGINKLSQDFKRCYIQKGSVVRGEKEEGFWHIPNVQNQEEEKINDSQISTFDSSVRNDDSLIIAENNKERSLIRKNNNTSSNRNSNSSPNKSANGLNSPLKEYQSEIVDQTLNLSSQNEEY